MIEIALATNNAHKIKEVQQIAALFGGEEVLRWHLPRDLGLMFEAAETALTYRDNALQKALALREALQRGIWVLADDSGLEVDALGGRPGIHSARYHQQAPNGDGCAALLEALAAVPPTQRKARFRCVLVLVSPEENIFVFEGTCSGYIATEKRGLLGFGFDPVFIPDGERRTFAEMRPEEKHALSHRGLAMQALLLWLRSQTGR